jgi:RNA polymerase sigma-70 factor (ECF subfamily)
MTSDDDVIADAWAAAQAAWPTVELDLPRFTEHVRARLGEVALEPGERRRAFVDLYLTCACLHGLPSAIHELDRVHLAHVAGFVRRIDASASFADEVRQELRGKLLMADGAHAPRIGDFSGSGGLLGWLRVAAVRTALNLARTRHRHRLEPIEQAAQALGAHHDLELEVIQGRYREVFQAAVRESIVELPIDQRNALRLHLVGGLTTARIGVMFQVNQSTVVRWLAAARAAVRVRTIERLRERLGISADEFESMVGLLLSRLDVSLESALAAENPR